MTLEILNFSDLRSSISQASFVLHGNCLCFPFTEKTVFTVCVCVCFYSTSYFLDHLEDDRWY